MLSPDEIRAINENYRQDFNRHDADALQNYYAESILWTNSSVEGEVTDPKEVSKQYKDFFITFPDVYLKFLDDFSENFHNAHRWIMKATHKNDSNEINDIEIEGFSMLIVDEKGKIVRDHTYFDVNNLNAQLGR